MEDYANSDNEYLYDDDDDEDNDRDTLNIIQDVDYDVPFNYHTGSSLKVMVFPFRCLLISISSSLRYFIRISSVL